MAQRGGSVLSTVRFGEHVWSPVAPHADVVIATELLEGIRGLDLLGPRGTLVCASPRASRRAACCAARRTTPTISPARPRRRGVRLVAVDAEALAREAGTAARRQRRAARRRQHGAARSPRSRGGAASRPPCRPRSSKSTSARSPSGAPPSPAQEVES